jgi:hypothetical protein
MRNIAMVRPVPRVKGKTTHLSYHLNNGVDGGFVQFFLEEGHHVLVLRLCICICIEVKGVLVHSYSTASREACEGYSVKIGYEATND